MKLIVNGHAQHGKDTVADMLADRFKLNKLNASMYIAEKVIMPALPNVYSCVEECYKDRVNWRDLWFQFLRFKVYHHQDFWVEFMKNSDVFCGHRSIDEFNYMLSAVECRTVWVHDPRKPMEAESSNEFQDMDLAYRQHDFVIINDSTLEDLRERVRLLGEYK